MTRARSAILLLLLAGCGTTTTPPPPGDRVESSIPRIAGIVLEPRMRRHADELAELRGAVRARDFPRVVAAARAILAEPRMARPSPAVGPTLNDELPARFFELQDRLVEATREVAAAAEARDADAVDDAFDSLTSTCRSCHALYRAHEPY